MLKKSQRTVKGLFPQWFKKFSLMISKKSIKFAIQDPEDVSL